MFMLIQFLSFELLSTFYYVKEQQHNFKMLRDDTCRITSTALCLPEVLQLDFLVYCLVFLVGGRIPRNMYDQLDCHINAVTLLFIKYKVSAKLAKIRKNIINGHLHCFFIEIHFLNLKYK